MNRLPGFLAFSFLLLVGGLVSAEELHANLAPHAAKYTSDVETLRATRKAALDQAQTSYVKQLEAAVQAAASEPALGERLRRERDGVISGLIAPANPEGFPAEVMTARKAFFAAVGSAAATFRKEKKALDDAYLKVLAGLAKQARGKGAPPGLARQVAAEKRRVAAGN